MSLHTGISRMGRLATLAGMTGVLVAGLGMPVASHAAGNHGRAANAKSDEWVVVSVAGDTAPTSMVVQRGPNSREFTVDISTSTTIVRRFNGKSDPSELNAGDHVQITAATPVVTATTPATTTTTVATAAPVITATAIKDNSIQVAYTQVNGRVVFVGRGLERMVVRVSANEGSNAAIPLGDIATVDTTSATHVDLIGKPNGTIADVRPGMVLTFYGLSDREGHIVFAPHDITQLLPTSAKTLTKAAPNDNTPK